MNDLRFLKQDGNTIPLEKSQFDISNFTDYDIPILYLSGNIGGISKDDKVTLNYTYGDLYGACTLKWQGSSSLTCPKKNYTLTLGNIDSEGKFVNEKIEIVKGWGAQSKYCLKANFVDASHARNIVCAKLWGQIVKSRTPSNDTLADLPNGGAIDGFPIIISLNGKFHGLYTWNIPKDGWMFGMDEKGQKAILCAETAKNGAVNFKGEATLVEDAEGYLDFEVEYSSTEDTAWIVTSINNLISAVKDSDGTNLSTISKYLDWESAIDYYIHATLIANYDGVQRNYLLSTYDGVKWFFTAYDMDVVLGLRSMGSYFYSANDTAANFESIAWANALFALIWKYKRPELRARYNELRASAMSVENVANMFVDFIADIPSTVYIDDVRRWNTIPSTSANNLSQIIPYYELRCKNADEWIKSTDGETEAPKYINQVPISIDTDGSYFNDGKGYIGQKRLSSTGVLKDNEYTSTTGYIPASSGAVVRIKGVAWNKQASCYVCSYGENSDGLPSAFIAAVSSDGGYGGGYVARPEGTDVIEVTLLTDAEIANLPDDRHKGPIKYIRVSSIHSSDDDGYNDMEIADRIEGPGSYMIVTVNQEIID